MVRMRHHIIFALLLFAGVVFLVRPVQAVQPAAQIAQKTAKTSTVASPTKTTAVLATAKKQSATTSASTTKNTPKPQTKKTVNQPDTAKKGKLAAGIGQTRPSKPKTAAASKQPAGKKSTARQKPKKSQTVAAAPTKAKPSATGPATGPLTTVDKMISSRSAIIMDARTGEELYAKSPDNPRQPASTIKIITGMIALKSLKNDEVVDVSHYAAGMPSSKIHLDPAKQYRANDLINAVLLSSANDASVALAEKIAGSEEKFANLMTISARMWGARNTVCRTASGLTAVGQQSTARDLANLFRYAMQDDEFARRMHEKFISTSYGKVLRNHNKALWRLDGAIGGKTGYTIAARQTYVGQFSRDDQTIVVAIMGSESMWADLEKLVDYGFRKKKAEQLARLQPSTAAASSSRIN